MCGVPDGESVLIAESKAATDVNRAHVIRVCLDSSTQCPAAQ